jgi:hypothetical protein
VATLHHPALGEHVEAFQALEPFDHLEADFAPGPQGPHPSREITRIGLLGPHQPEPGQPVTEDLQAMVSALALLPVGGRHDHRQPEAQGIDEDMPLAPLDLLGPVHAAAPPFAVVLTAWLARIPALGGRCLPAAPRTSPRSRSCITGQVPSCCHWRKS